MRTELRVKWRERLEHGVKKNLLFGLVKEAEHHLCNHDAVMKRLIALYGPCPFAEREYEPFPTLVTSIISQQLSSKAADTIGKRIAEIVSLPFDPKRFLEVSPEALRGAGLSFSKVRYIR